MKSHPAEGSDQLLSFITFDDLPPLLEQVEVQKEVLADLKKVPSESRLETKDLKIGPLSQYEMGEEMELPDGTKVRPIRLKQYENKILFADPKLVIRQPRQPRSYFNSEKMQKTAVSIGTYGQLEAVHVVPVLFPDNRTCRLMLIEGERRFRIILNISLPRIKLEVNWARNEQEIHERSFIINKKEPHTIFEASDAYARMVDVREKKGIGRGEALEEVAYIVQETVADIRSYLKLQVINEEARQILGDRIGLTGAKAIVEAIEAAASEVDQVALAKRIVDQPVFAQRGPNVGALSLAYVRTASADYLHQSGNITPETKKRLAAGNALDEIKRAINIAARAVVVFEKQTDLIPYMVEKLRAGSGRSKPIFSLAEDVEGIIQGLRSIYKHLIEPASEVPSLEKPPSAPQFRDHAENRMKTLRGNPLHERIVRVLAHVSDSEKQTPLTAQEIAQVLTKKGFSVDSVMVANNLQHGVLPERISQMGFELDIYETRRRTAGRTKTVSGRTDLQIVNAYRLRWNDEMLEKFRRG